ncbi:nucleoside hydrolase [Chitinophaga agrisoli]|nr:nucleoside hydrolase [Chitinophaga agrisoli]
MQAQSPLPVILDTDIAGDYDDVGAMTLLHAFADKGEAKILAVISCNAFETTVPTISVLNTYFKRPDIPIGITHKAKPDMDCPQQWAQAIIAKYPHRVRSNKEAEEAVSLYRRILVAQPDHAVTIITIGFFTNLADLLQSGPDQYSPLSGRALVQQKVKALVAMATSVPPGKEKGREYNVYVDTEAARAVFEQWETPITLSPLEVGEQLHTGIPLTKDAAITDSPVKDAFSIALEKDKNTQGRMSWDQTAVLVAIKTPQPWFNERKINLRIEADGSNTLIPGERFTLLELKEGEKLKLQEYIESLMHHQPK